MSEPLWLALARQDIGLRELEGAPAAPRIAAWLQQLGAWWEGDEVPWCGTAVAAWMKATDISRPKHWYRAKGWLEWGQPLASPAVGAVVVFERAGGGHVGLIVGRDNAGRLLVLGGNQGNAVSIAPFDMSRVAGYRWPGNHPVPLTWLLPLMASAGASSSNEA